MIFNVLRLVPASNLRLYRIIESKFPFWLKDKESLVWYTNQSFKVLDYLPSIRRQIFHLLIDKCVEIDVNILIKDNGDATIDETEQKKNEEQSTSDLNSKEDKSKLTTSVDILSDKLDALLELLFQQIQFGCENGISSTREIYNELFPIFQSTILTTHKSKFVQFCIFLPCGLETQIVKNNEKNVDDESREASVTVLPTNQLLDSDVENEDEPILHREFVSKLLQILVDPRESNTVRQSCACYLASFVSRASFVGIDTVCESISAMLRWAEAYIGSLGVHAVRAADARRQSDRHSLFYTVCQAAFYIMSFRGNEAIEYYKEAVSNEKANASGTSNGDLNTKDDDPHYPDVESINLENKRWTFLCGHALQPLRFCLESVRSEFLHVAHFYGMIDEEVLNKLVADAKRQSTGRVNKKAASSISTAATLERRRQTGGVGGLGRGSNPLKSFFPFDPLLLRQSHEHIEPLYKYWQGPVEEEDVLVIDEIERDRDPTFDMDDESISDSEVESGDSDNDSDDSDVNSDRFNSDDDYVTSREMQTPDTNKIRLLQKRAWTETLKRPRSHSLENSSW
jgi:RNA polymerase I-specific transcription initiation factor RRN3